MDTCITCNSLHSDPTKYICIDCLSHISNGDKFLQNKTLFEFMLDVINFTEKNQFIVDNRLVVDVANLVDYLQRDTLLTSK